MCLKEFITKLWFGAFWSLLLSELLDLEERYFCCLQQLSSNNVSLATRETVNSMPFGRKPEHPGVVTSREEICKAQIFMEHSRCCLFSCRGMLTVSWWDLSIFKVISGRKIHSFRVAVEPIYCVSIVLSLILLFLTFLNVSEGKIN